MKLAAAILAFILCAFCASAYAITLPPGSSIKLIDLGTLGGIASIAYDINDAGTVIGWSETANGDSHAFCWRTDTGIVDLKTLPGGHRSIAYRINAKGQILGVSDTASGETYDVIWENGKIKNIGVKGNINIWIQATGGTIFNSIGQFIGSSATNDIYKTDACLWSNSMGLIKLGLPNASLVQPVPYYLNDNGIILGGFYDGMGVFSLKPLDTNNDGKPDKWYSGGADGINDLMKVMPGFSPGGLNSSGIAAINYGDIDYTAYKIDLNMPQPTPVQLPLPEWGRQSIVYGINDAGQIIGLVADTDGYAKISLWDDKGVTILSSKPIAPSASLILGLGISLSINRFGQVIGNEGNSFYADKMLGVVDLKNLGGYSCEAYKINSSGWAVGYSDIPTGPSHATLWKIKVPLVMDIGVNPETSPNEINLTSEKFAFVAIYSTDNLNATKIKPDTVRFAGAIPISYYDKDINGYGKKDRVFKFRTSKLKHTDNPATLTFTGKTISGKPIWGKDTVTFK